MLKLGGRKSCNRSRFIVGLLFLDVVSVEFRSIDVKVPLLQFLSIYMDDCCTRNSHSLMKNLGRVVTTSGCFDYSGSVLYWFHCPSL